MRDASPRIRAAHASDLDALCALENKVFAADRISRRSFRWFLSSPWAKLIAVEFAGRLAGYALIHFRPRSAVARLYSIAVAPEVAGRGIGGKLMRAAETAALERGCAAMRLEVDLRNTRAAQLYLQAGYQEFGRRKHYYEDGGTALRLEKSLASHTGRARAAKL